MSGVGSPRVHGEPVGEPPLVADPRVVDLALVAGEDPHDLPAADVDADVAPAAAVPADASAVVRSNGRATKRYGVEVSAPTGQIWTVLPLKGERKSSPGRDRHVLARPAREQLQEAVAADLVAEPGAPRAEHAPLAVQVHERRHRDGLGEDPLRVAERGSPGPNARAWSWSGHSPPRSQIGQSSGWFSSRNSRFASCAWAAGSLVYCVAPPSPGPRPPCTRWRAWAGPRSARSTGGTRRPARGTGGRRTGGTRRRAVRPPGS